MTQRFERSGRRGAIAGGNSPGMLSGDLLQALRDSSAAMRGFRICVHQVAAYRIELGRMRGSIGEKEVADAGNDLAIEFG